MDDNVCNQDFFFYKEFLIFVNYSISHVYWECNVYAHWLAKFLGNLDYFTYFTMSNHLVPLKDLLRLDKFGLPM